MLGRPAILLWLLGRRGDACSTLTWQININFAAMHPSDSLGPCQKSVCCTMQFSDATAPVRTTAQESDDFRAGGAPLLGRAEAPPHQRAAAAARRASRSAMGPTLWRPRLRTAPPLPVPARAADPPAAAAAAAGVCTLAVPAACGWDPWPSAAVGSPAGDAPDTCRPRRRGCVVSSSAELLPRATIRSALMRLRFNSNGCRALGGTALAPYSRVASVAASTPSRLCTC